MSKEWNHEDRNLVMQNHFSTTLEYKISQPDYIRMENNNLQHDHILK